MTPRCGGCGRCRRCRLLRDHPGKYGRVFGPPPAARPPCAFEGPVVSFCASCGGNEARHVRACYHDANPTETCTRGHPAASVWRCSLCPHHSPG